jgi:hypothetical protein
MYIGQGADTFPDMQFLASKDQAKRNKSVGQGSNLTLAQF